MISKPKKIYELTINLKKEENSLERLKEIVKLIKNKKYIFVKGPTGSGKSYLIEKLREEKIFKNYEVLDFFEIIKNKNFYFEENLFEKSIFIEIQEIKDIKEIFEIFDNKNLKKVLNKSIILDLNIYKQNQKIRLLSWK